MYDSLKADFFFAVTMRHIDLTNETIGFYEFLRHTINHSLCSQPSSEENRRTYDKKYQVENP